MDERIKEWTDEVIANHNDNNDYWDDAADYAYEMEIGTWADLREWFKGCDESILEDAKSCVDDDGIFYDDPFSYIEWACRYYVEIAIKKELANRGIVE